MALSDQGKAALMYWGEISAAVEQHATTAQLWAAVRAAQAAAPGPLPTPTIQGINEVRSAAARIRNSSDTLGAARAASDRSGLDTTITSAMLSTAPWSRDAQQLSTLADYQVRFEAKTIGPDGTPGSQWLTALFPAGSLPTTVGELVDALSAFGPASGSLQDSAMEDVGDVEILAI